MQLEIIIASKELNRCNIKFCSIRPNWPDELSFLHRVSGFNLRVGMRRVDIRSGADAATVIWASNHDASWLGGSPETHSRHVWPDTDQARSTPKAFYVQSGPRKVLGCFGRISWRGRQTAASMSNGKKGCLDRPDVLHFLVCFLPLGALH